MTAPIYPILRLLAQIDRLFFASPRQRRTLIADWQRHAQDAAQPALS